MLPEPSRMVHNISTIAATDVEITITLITLIASTLFFIILIAAGGGIASLCGMGFMRFVRYAWPVLLLPSLLLLYGYIVGRNLLQVKEVSVGSHKLPPAFDGYRIVQISDLHLRSFASRPLTGTESRSS